MSGYPGYDGKYHPDASQEWLREVLEKFNSRPLPDGSYLLSGKCPRCNHDTNMVVQARTVDINISFATAPRPGQPDVTGLQILYCSCVDDHEGREDPNLGCGIYGKLVVKYGNQ